MISLDSLILLDAIARHGSLAAAAQSLHRVPSAVTHALRKLEQGLGYAVFEKASRPPQLTEAGRILLDDGRELLAAAEALTARARRAAGGWEACVRLALDALLDPAEMLPVLAGFYAAGHRTEVRLSREVLAGVWDAVLSGRADLAIGAPGDPPPGCGLRVLPYASAELVFAVAPTHPLATGPTGEVLTAAQIRPYRAIVLGDTSRQLDARSAGLIAGQDLLAVPDLAAKVAAQRAGLGVGHLPLALARREAAAGHLVLRRTEVTPPVTPLHLAWRADHRGEALHWFIAALREGPAELHGFPKENPT